MHALSDGPSTPTRRDSPGRAVQASRAFQLHKMLVAGGYDMYSFAVGVLPPFTRMEYASSWANLDAQPESVQVPSTHPHLARLWVKVRVCCPPIRGAAGLARRGLSGSSARGRHSAVAG